MNLLFLLQTDMFLVLNVTCFYLYNRNIFLKSKDYHENALDASNNEPNDQHAVCLFVYYVSSLTSIPAFKDVTLY